MKKILLTIFFSILFAHANLPVNSFKKLQKAQTLIEKKSYKEAKTILKSLLSSKNNSVQSYALQTMASIYLETNQIHKAATSYEKILQLNAFKQNDVDRIKFVLSQIYLSNDNAKKGLQYALELRNSKVIKKEKLYENITLGYYYTKNYQKSIAYVQKTLKLKQNVAHAKKGAKPSLESWYKILYVSYFELKQYKQAITTIKHLIKNYDSKEEYWMQLVLIYQNLNNQKKMLSTLELAFDKNFINTKRNIDYFVVMLLQNNLFNKAATLIETGIKKHLLKNNKENFERLVMAHYNAKNIKQTIQLLKHSTYAKTSKYQIMLGNLFYNEGQYAQVISLMKAQKFQKNTQYAGQKDILLALSYFELHQEQMTKKHLKLARLNKYEKKRATNLIKQLGYKL